MYHLDFKKLESHGESELTTCQRDFNDTATKSMEQPLAIMIKPRHNKFDDSPQKLKNAPSIDLEAYSPEQKSSLKQSNLNEEMQIIIGDSGRGQENGSHYSNTINKYVNSLNSILQGNAQNNNKNLIVPKKNPFPPPLSEESYYSYYSGDDSQVFQKSQIDQKRSQRSYMGSVKQEPDNNNNQNIQNINAYNSKNNKIQNTKAQQLNVLLSNSLQVPGDNRQLHNSVSQVSEFIQGNEKLDENYSYYEKSNHGTIERSNMNSGRIIQNKDGTKQNKSSFNKPMNGASEVTPFQLNGQNQSIYVGTIDNKSQFQSKKLETSQMQSSVNEEKQNPTNTEKCCKICLEETSTAETGQLLSPCNCNGSMQFIHEECLKTWLVTQQMDIDSAACELCKKEYNMEITIAKKFQLKYACQEGQISFISCICLFILVVGMLTIIFLFSFKWDIVSTDSDNSSSSGNGNSNGNPSNGNDNSKGSGSGESSFSYKISILIACIIICAVILVLLILSIKEAFFVDYMKQWRIYNFNKEVTHQKKKKKKSDKERLNLNQQAAINARMGNSAFVAFPNQQSLNMMRNSNQQAQNRNQNSIQQNSQANQLVNNRSQMIQTLQNGSQNIHTQQVTIPQQNQQDIDKSIVNQLIHDSSMVMNENPLDNTLMHLKETNQNAKSLSQLDQHNQVIDDGQELQIALNLVNDNHENQKDDYNLDESQTQNSRNEQIKGINGEQYQSQKSSYKIISSHSKQKLSQNDISKSPSKGRFANNKNSKITSNNNNNNNNIVNDNLAKVSLANSRYEVTPNNKSSVQKQTLNNQVIGEECISQNNSIDPNEYLNQINRILNDIPPQFQKTDQQNDVVFNVLITKQKD